MSTTPHSLKAYLDKNRCSGPNWNLTGLGGLWSGKYLAPDDEYDDFLTLVHDHIFIHKKACSMVERHKDYSPIVIDLDFRYTAGGPLVRRFTDEHLKEFVASYANAISYFFGPRDSVMDDEYEDRHTLQFFVTLKPSPELDVSKDVHKDGAHIVCPNVTLPRSMLCAIRGYLLQTGVIERIFGQTGIVNQPHDILDLTVIRPQNPNNWFLYGACKPDKASYSLSHVYSVNLVDNGDDSGYEIEPRHLVDEPIDAWTNLDLIKRLSLRVGHDTPTQLTPRPETQEEWDVLFTRWGPGQEWTKMKKTVAPKGGAGGGEVEDEMGDGADGKQDGSRGGVDGEFVQISGLNVRAQYSDADIDFAFRIVETCLNPVKRAKSYHDWVSLGMLLHNISTSDKSCNVWAKISRRVPGNEGNADSVYIEKWALLPAEASAIQKGRKMLMMGTLHLWAKIDNPVLYDKMTRQANTEMALLNSVGTHDTVANLVFRMYREEFRCTPPKKGARAADFEWFQYEKHGWKSLITWTALRTRLSTDVRDIYLTAESKVIGMMQSTNGDDRDRLEVQKKNISKITTQLQTTGFKDNVMKELSDKFYDEDLIRNMNQDPTLVGFENGVLELERMGDDGNLHVFFRPGRPDDCISFQMGRGIIGLDSIPYIPYDPNHPLPEHLQIIDFFEKIYPDSILREFMWILLSACLKGVNQEQLFFVLSGCGGNGKSKLLDLLTKTFGELQDSLNATALTRKRADAGSANPEFIEMKNKRVVTMVEPEEGEKINTSLMKQLTGGDMCKFRGLFKGQEGFVFTARIFMSCNSLPPVTTMDEGTWRRICVIPHVATFVKDGMPTDPSKHIHPRDPQMDVKIGKWRPYFAGMLVWYFEHHYLRKGLIVPDIVMTESNKYKDANDVFANFVRDCIVRDSDEELRVQDVYSRYKEWSKFNLGTGGNNKNGPTLLKAEVIRERMTAMFGKPLGDKTYVGIRFTQEEEDASGNLFTR